MRWTTSTALVVGWVLIVLLLLYFLELRPRLGTEVPNVTTVPTVQADFPAPPEGAVVYSRALGEDALALGVLPEADRLVLQASVVGPQGEGVSGLDVRFRVQGSAAEGRSCGPGCYRAAVTPVAPPTTVDVVVTGDATGRWSVPLPTRWPPADAGQEMARAERVWRALRSLSFEETLSSGPTSAVASSWQLQAPDRLAYQVVGGASGVIIGAHRWDKVAPGKPWKKGPQSRIHQPTPPWVEVTNARIVGRTTARGRPALVITFFDPKTPGWFRVVVDRDTFRTYDLHMVATAHFMHDRMHSFDRTAPIRPPVR
jgi:hypothetical protein